MKKNFLVAALLVLVSSAWAGEGGVRETGNGGDFPPLDAQMLKRYFKGKLRQQLMSYVYSMHLLPSEPERELLLKFNKGHELGKAIFHARYEFKSPCIDAYGKRRSAVAKRWDRGGSICVDLDRMAKRRPAWNEVLGLMMHEFAHHFGIEDKDHTLAAYVAFTAPALGLEQPDLLCIEGVPARLQDGQYMCIY